MHIDLLVMQVVIIFYLANIKLTVLFCHSSTIIYIISTQTQIILVETSKTEILSSYFFSFIFFLQLFIMFKMFNYKKKK